MSGDVVAMVTIPNPKGLHARPSQLIVKCANDHDAQITMHVEDREADCRSIMEVMMLACPQGTEVRIAAEGPDARAALSALVALIEGGFGEAYD